MLPQIGRRSLTRLKTLSVCRYISTTRPQWRHRKGSEKLIRELAVYPDLRPIGRNDGSRISISQAGFQGNNDLQQELDRFLSTVNRRVEELLYSAYVRGQVVGASRTDEEFEQIVLQFRDTIMNNLTERMKDGNYQKAPARTPTPEELFEVYNKDGKRGLVQLLVNYFRRYFIYHGGLPAGHNYEKATSLADMRNPGEWFPGARNMRRRIIMHVGPTNSGKTYQALQRLEKAKSGWYGGPLRLLAHEVFNRMNNKGIKCNLKTGEEIRVVDINAPLTASTIEMWSETNSYDTAVIDEIQMLGDPSRGHAWTAALLGLRAKELHVCGEEAAVPLVTAIAKELGEEVEVHTYQRLSPLKAASEPLRKITDVKPGDCVVSFSRTSIFNIRDRIEKATKLKCALVYGALPPETRTLQANLFNDTKSGYDVLVASDAIGMGLNLKIKRIIFATIKKFDAGELVQLQPPHIKQIAGRAGRFGTTDISSNSPGGGPIGGLVLAMDKSDMEVIRHAMAIPNPSLERAYLWPPFKVFEKFAQQFPEGTPLATTIARFIDVSKTSTLFQSAESEGMMKLAHAIEHLPNIDLESRYNISFAPIQTSKDEQMEIFVRFAEVLSDAKPIAIDSPLLGLPLHLAKSPGKASKAGLEQLEMLHKLITCYCWLAVRWPALYTKFSLAEAWKERTEFVIHEALLAFNQNEKRTHGKIDHDINDKLSKLDSRYPDGQHHEIAL